MCGNILTVLRSAGYFSRWCIQAGPVQRLQLHIYIEPTPAQVTAVKALFVWQVWVLQDVAFRDRGSPAHPS